MRNETCVGACTTEHRFERPSETMSTMPLLRRALQRAAVVPRTPTRNYALRPIPAGNFAGEGSTPGFKRTVVTAPDGDLSTSTRPLRVGLIGGGCVGGGVVHIIKARQAEWEAAGTPIEVSMVAVRDLTRKRDWECPSDVALVGDWRDVVNNPDIDVVVEVMGGTTVAGEVTESALALGKHVVSANKALLATQLSKYSDLARQSAGTLGWEAAVAGGIPIIRALQTSLLPDRVTSISGIMNGTTNFILSEMEVNGVALAPTLTRAQELGYAEEDPTADVEGHDAQQKLVLLAKLAFGVTIDVDSVPTTGIMGVVGEDFELLKRLDSRTVRLLGVALPSDKGYAAFVSPCAVPLQSTLGAAMGCGNVVSLEAEQVGELCMTGPGAGRFATANSVVADILAIRSGESRPFPRRAVRLSCPDTLPAAGTAARAFPRLSTGGAADVDTNPSMKVYLRASGEAGAVQHAVSTSPASLLGSCEVLTSQSGGAAAAISASAVPLADAEEAVRELEACDGVTAAVAYPLYP